MVRYRRTFSMMARLFMLGSPHSFSRARICGTTIFDSLAGLGERTCGFRTIDGATFRTSETRPRQSPVRAACGEAAEFPLEQTTLVRKNSPSSAHAGSIVRAQNAR